MHHIMASIPCVILSGVGVRVAQANAVEESLPMTRRSYFTYIMGSLSGTLYIGVTSNIEKRVFQHRFHCTQGFTGKYNVGRLLYCESYDDIHKAIAREKQLKGWSRVKKTVLIESCNAHWLDLAKDWYPWMK